jgi:hypothetical protein
MAPKDNLIIRIEPAEKEKIRQAAIARGESLTTFIRRTCLREAEKELKKKDKQMENASKLSGVPTFFRLGCLEAQRGGTNGYFAPAWHLAIHTEENMPDECEDEELWENTLDELRGAAGSDDYDAVWDWYCRVFPKCMELVPARRKDQFVQGVIKAWEDDRL